jgi:hypothetical protein
MEGSCFHFLFGFLKKTALENQDMVVLYISHNLGLISDTGQQKDCHLEMSCMVLIKELYYIPTSLLTPHHFFEFSEHPR